MDGLPGPGLVRCPVPDILRQRNKGKNRKILGKMLQTKKKAWYLANTTVRNALRLKDGLRVLVDSPLHGNLEGREREQQLAILLHNTGVVFVARFRDGNYDNDATDVGRKWRSAWMKMGFIRPSFSKDPYTVTPNGRRLMASSTVSEEQECFLRALIALQLPSPIEPFLKVSPFSPFRLIFGGHSCS